MKVTIETVEEFDALPAAIRHRIMEIIKVSALVVGCELDGNPEMSDLCSEMINGIMEHPMAEQIGQYIIRTDVEDQLKLRMLRGVMKEFLQ